MTVPCGYRFHPTEKELLVYLKRKIHNLPLPCDIIKEVELYKYDPSDLIDQFISKGEEKCYFFTPTYRKYANGSRPNRSTKNGYWKSSTADVQIKDERNYEIGSKRTLVFYYGDYPHGRKSNWIMHEYKLIECQSNNHVQIPSNPMKLDEWVLCSIYDHLSAERKREERKRKATEILDAGKEKRAIVLQQEPQIQINEYKDNDQSVASSYDILQKEHIHDASDVDWEIGLMSDSDIADFTELLEMMATEESVTKHEKRATVVQQEQPLVKINEYANDDPSVGFSGIHDASYMSWDLPPLNDSDFAGIKKMLVGEELDTRSKVNVVQQGPQIRIGEDKDNDQSIFFSYDDLQKVPLLDALDVLGWELQQVTPPNQDQ